MNDVLIVARTRMQQRHICVAGLDLITGELIRLTDHRGTNYSEMAPYQPGEVWRIDYQAKYGLTRPHVEDVRILHSSLQEPHADIPALLDKHPTLRDGSPRELFDGALTFEPSLGLDGFDDARTPYLNRRSRIPRCSIELWLTDRFFTKRVTQRDGQPKTYLVGPPPSPADVSMKAPYNGFDDPGLILPPGTLVSVSLARWWRPFGDDPAWDKCHMQLCNVLWRPDRA